MPSVVVRPGKLILAPCLKGIQPCVRALCLVGSVYRVVEWDITSVEVIPARSSVSQIQLGGLGEGQFGVISDCSMTGLCHTPLWRLSPRS